MDERCDYTLTTRKDGPEPYRCTKPWTHTSAHELVQESTGQARTIESGWCTGGRIYFITRQHA